MRTLEGNVAVVTGGTFGVGRGIARELARHGARVFVTGRSAQDATNDEHITSIRCDHRLDAEVAAAFERVSREQIQILSPREDGEGENGTVLPSRCTAAQHSY